MDSLFPIRRNRYFTPRLQTKLIWFKCDNPECCRRFHVMVEMTWLWWSALPIRFDLNVAEATWLRDDLTDYIAPFGG